MALYKTRCALRTWPLILMSCLLTSGFGDESDEVTYRRLVEKVRGGDLSVDFRILRLTCMKVSQCQPRGSLDGLADLNVEDPSKAADAAEKLIEEGFVNIEAHATAAGAYLRLRNPKKANAHMAITRELMRSIMNGRDGKTKENAFEVICDREEYVVLSALGLPYTPPEATLTPLNDGLHSYERWSVRDPKTGQSVVLFFNIDAFQAKSRVRNK